MIGNNLERDIVGANRMGITSVLAGYSPRYRMKPENEEETPDYVVCDPSEIPALIEMLDKQMENKKQFRLVITDGRLFKKGGNLARSTGH